LSRKHNFLKVTASEIHPHFQGSRRGGSSVPA
jgi:hypothetical protein